MFEEMIEKYYITPARVKLVESAGSRFALNSELRQFQSHPVSQRRWQQLRRRLGRCLIALGEWLTDGELVEAAHL